MRNNAFVLALLVSVAALNAQEPSVEKSKNKLPEKGSTITIKGCITGSSSLQDDETGLTYRLKGDKAFLKDLGNEHKGHVDELTGILQSSLLMAGSKGKRVGNTTISIGAAESRNTGPRELIPIFEAKSLKHLQTLCTK
jgi:hypothetical protein